MNTKFKKLALSAGIAAALGGFSMPSHAIIEGAAGEALLVPFVIYDDVAGVNTIVELTVPGSVGLDTIPNNFTASHSTPTGHAINTKNPALTPSPSADPVANSGIHWYFFNKRSEHLDSGTIPVTADDFIQFDWGQVVRNNGNSFNQVEGYLVFGTEKAASDIGQPAGGHAAANFSFFGDAYLVVNNINIPFGLVDAKIPVLPMNDGVDAPGQTKVTVDNQVLYHGTEVMQVSPLISGMRTVWSDGIPNIVAFDLTLGPRQYPTLHVFWNDHNGADIAPGYHGTLDVFDDAERRCDSSVPLPNELNTIWGSPNNLFFLAPTWVDTTTQLCFPNGISDSALLDPGFVRYQIDEQGDTNIGVPEQAGVAFSIQYLNTKSADGLNSIVPVETALGHERGKFF